jgi:DNA-binding NarL/FixJ family response regulator
MDIVLVDDHMETRREIASLINEREDLRVVGEAGDGAEGLRLARTLHPDVVVMDVVMPEMNGITAAAAIRKHFPETKIVMLSNHTGKHLVDILLQAGANGFVRKDRAHEELIPAIRAVAQKEHYIGKCLKD